MFLHVGKLKKPSRQFCQQFTEMYLISEVELSREGNLILLNYHSKMPKCWFFYTLDRRVAANTVTFPVDERGNKQKICRVPLVPTSPPRP